MNIGLVLPNNGISGGIYVMYRHGHFLQEQGHNVVIVFTSRRLGKDVKCYPNFSLKTYYLDETQDHEFDILVVTWWKDLFAAPLLKWQSIAYFVQGDARRGYEQDPVLRELVTMTYVDKSLHLVTEARWIAAMLRDEYGRDASYAPNGIDLALFNPDVTPLDSRPTEKLRVLIEGPGGNPTKRVGMAFDVTNRLHNAEVWYVCVDGYVEKGWRHDRKFVSVALKEMAAIYASCHVLLKLSVHEGFFGPPLEMMACGGTAVVGRVTGHEEYIRHEHNALVVDLDDVEEALRAVERLQNDREFREELSRHGLETAQGMSWEDRCPMFEKSLINFAAKPTIPFDSKKRDHWLLLWLVLEQGDRLQRIEHEARRGPLKALFSDIWHQLKRLSRRYLNGERTI
jgi:glycosyltransferase involved in cell wall biosynthesis